KPTPRSERVGLRSGSTMVRSCLNLPSRARTKGASRVLIPKRVKYRRVHRGRMTGVAHRGNEVTFGEYGLQALEPGWIKNTQIEAARVAMTRHIRRDRKSACRERV